MNFIQKKLWITWSKLRFLRLPVERRVRLEVTTDGRHITFLLVSLYEAGYGVQVFGGDWFFRELMLLRKTAPIPFLYGGKEMECGIPITDQPSTLDAGRSSLFVLDYDYFSGLMERVDAHPGGWAAARETAARQPEGQDERERTSQITRIEAEQAGLRLAGQAGAEFSNPFTSELAQDSENTSPTRSANGPAEEALRAEMQRSGNIEPRMTRIYTDGQQGDAQGTCAGDAFSNPFTSELAQDSENTSPTRSASVPAGAFFADNVEIESAGGNQLADSMELLEGQSQAGLQMDNQKNRAIRPANALRASGEKSESVLIRDIRGQKSGNIDFPPQALRAPYFMHPSVYHRSLHKSRLPTRHSPQRQRRFRIGFFGTHDLEFYTKHYHFPGMNRFEILEAFFEKFADSFVNLEGPPEQWPDSKIAVSIDTRGGDRSGKTFLSQDRYFEALRQCDFVLSPPGWCMPVSHNLIEAMFCGAIPITNGGAFMAEPLKDGETCLAFKNVEELAAAVERALAMDVGEVERMRWAVLDYYERFLEPNAFGEVAMQSNSSRILVNAEEKSVPLVFAGMIFPWDVPADTMQT